MRSIRLSLVVYFLGLLTLALGGALLLVYRTSEQMLQDKKQAMINQIEATYEQRVREERRRLDDDLENQAINLAGRLVLQQHWNRMHYRGLHCLGMISAAQAPCGYVNVVPWWVQAHPLARGKGPLPPIPPVPTEIWRRTVVDTTVHDADLVLPTGRNPMEFWQVDTNGWGKSRTAASMRDRTFSQVENFGNGVYHKEVDEVELSPGLRVRRVRVMASRFKTVWGNPFKPRPDKTPRLEPPRYEPPPLKIMVHAAADLATLQATLEEIKGERDTALAGLEAESSASRMRLSQRLWTIASVTFAATITGTVWLVWLGLLPLRRMSVAVSQVSPKDFRLPLDHVRLPLELRPISDRLRDTLDMLKRAFEREKQATADISHELRTPLAALLTTIELGLRKPRTGEYYRELLEDCHTSAKHMHQIVERLLTLARIDAGVDRLKMQPVDVAELAHQCATVVRPLAEARGLQLSVTPATVEQNAFLRTDPDKLREVLNNLLHNAIQYNRPSGRIDLEVSQGNGRVELAVRDTGIGIPEAARERIFERFFRADPSRNADGMHAGLGLAIVKEYVELMGGKICVESEEGRGSTFRIELPAQPASATAA